MGKIDKIFVSLMFFGFFAFLSFGEVEADQQEEKEVQENLWDKVVLRIDDGPTKYTEKLVETIKKLKIKNANFYVIGENCLTNNGKIDEAKSKILKQIIEEGWTIGNHTMHHPELIKTKKDYFLKHPEEWEKEIKDCEEILFKILGFYPKSFATPGIPAGKNLPEKLKEVVKNLNLEFDLGWTIDSSDSRKGKKILPPQEVAEKIKESQGEIIFLVHDKKETASYLEEINNYLIKKD